MEKEEEYLTKRFIEEFEKLGVTKSKLAAEIGFTPQTLTNVTKGYNLPSVMLLNRIKSMYPSFDNNYIVDGVRSGDESEIVKKLTQQIAIKDATIAKLVMPSFKSGASNHPQIDREGGSDLLTSITRKNTAISNLSMLNFATRPSKNN